MNEAKRGAPTEAYGNRDDVFADLMAFRVRDILMVSSAYDSYILEEDGLLGESLDVEYLQLNLSAAPRITRVATGEEALALLGRATSIS